MNSTKVIEEPKSAIGRMCIAVLGQGFKGFNIAHKATTERIGAELLEMVDNEEYRNVDLSCLGTFHFCLQLPKQQFNTAIERVKEYGGKVCMDIHRCHPED